MRFNTQKLIKIGEQHVQWVALGLAVLYLVFMGYSYIYKSDIFVARGPKPEVDPGEIDMVIAKGPIAELQTQMANTDPLVITPPNVVAGWNGHVDELAVNYESLPPVTGSNPYGENGGTGPIKDNGPRLAQINELPIIPPATPVAVAAYRTVAQVPNPAFVAQPAGAAAPPDGGAAAAQPPMIPQDIDATSVQFKIDMKALAAAFTKAFPANAQPAVFLTMYLKVSLWRQEETGPDTWGPAKEIAPLSINTPSDYPGDTPNLQQGFIYEKWAGANQELIIHPPFFQANPPWSIPTPPPPAADAAPAAPGAAAPAGGAPAGPGIARPLPQPLPPPTFIPPAPAFDPAAQQAAAWQGQVFNPVLKGTDEVIIAHDATVEPEKTYRYYVQYRLLNTVFGAQRLAVKPDLTKQFALISPGPDVAPPSAAITIPSRTQLFVKQVHNSTEAHFTVFVFAPEPKETEVVAAPGDSIAPTHWTLVDIRRSENSLSPGDYQVVLVDENGHLQTRDFYTDRDDPAQKDLHDKANAAAPPAPAALAQ